MRARGLLDDVTDTDIAEMRCQSTPVVEKVYRGMKASERKAHTQLRLRQLMEAELLTTGVRPPRWDDDSLHAALRIRVKLSQQQYEFLSSIGYSLPGRTTLQMVSVVHPATR
ncbi:hypothetical protein FJT64_011957 [Amphibalanus amphitrite]|uniref:Uncharacterized protein n=1 Tax=Amphibalanus amphitrite TaxID=1232801 RepID=A0A6A4V813_AMPAM|nr:hypothetical protein FJT64_011957 [Amphibalanus amphitrite]